MGDDETEAPGFFHHGEYFSYRIPRDPGVWWDNRTDEDRGFAGRAPDESES